MTMAQACPPPFAIKCCSEECALTKPPPVRDWDWQSFAILPNFTRGRSRWTTHLWAVCARASGCPPECLLGDLFRERRFQPASGRGSEIERSPGCFQRTGRRAASVAIHHGDCFPHSEPKE